MMAVLNLLFLICSTRTNVGLFVIFVAAVPGFAALAGAHWKIALGQMEVANTLTVVRLNSQASIDPRIPMKTGADCLFTSGQWSTFLCVRDRRVVPFVCANAGDHTDAVSVTRWRPESINDKEGIDHRKASRMKRHNGKHRNAALPCV